MSALKVPDPKRTAVVQCILQKFPGELQKRPQFVTWRYEQVGGRRTKILYNPNTGRRASSTESSTWCAVSTAFAMFLYSPHYDGVGFVFSADDPYCGIDLDHCVENGVISPEAQGLVDTI